MTSLTPKQARALWVHELRTTTMRQGRGCLAPSPDERCCLGVACDLAVKHGVIKHYGPILGGLPLAVEQWLGLRGLYGVYEAGSLDGDNDRGLSFAAIADIIESEPPGLIADGAT